MLEAIAALYRANGGRDGLLAWFEDRGAEQDVMTAVTDTVVEGLGDAHADESPVVLG
jgi:hypothetical protein